MYLKNVPKLSIRLPNIIIYNNSPCFIAFYLEIQIFFCIFVDFLPYNILRMCSHARALVIAHSRHTVVFAPALKQYNGKR